MLHHMNDRIVYTFSHMWVCYRVQRGLFFCPLSLFILCCVAMMYSVLNSSGFIDDDGRHNANCLRCDFSLSRCIHLALALCFGRGRTIASSAANSEHFLMAWKTFFMQSQSWNNCVVNNVIKITNDRTLSHIHTKKNIMMSCFVVS